MHEATPIRVVVGEDQTLVREGIVRIRERAGIEVLAVAADAQDLVRKAGAHSPDLVITNIQMPPDMTDDGLRAAKQIRSAQPQIGVMFPVTYWSAPIDTPTGRGAVLAFTDIEEQRAAERAKRERDIAQAREAEARAAQRRVIEAGDAARRQVTRDLHDGAQHKLVNVVINLQLTRDMRDSDPGQARALLDTTADQARAAIDDLRELSAGMHPTLLTTHGLFAAVEALSDRLPLPIAIDVARRASRPQSRPVCTSSSRRRSPTSLSTPKRRALTCESRLPAS